MSTPDSSGVPEELSGLNDSYARAAGAAEKLAAGMRLSAALSEKGRYLEALRVLQEIAGHAGCPGDRAAVLRGQGWIYLRLSEYERAYQLLGEALELLSSVNSLELFQVYYDIAWMFYRQGYLENARNYRNGAELVLENLGQSPAANTEAARVELLHITALIDAAAGDHAAAAASLRIEVEAHRRSGDNYRLAGACNKLASVSLALGDFGQALEWQRQAHDVSQRCDETFRLALSHKNYGDIYFVIGDLDQSLEHYQRSFQIAQELHNRLGEVFSVSGIGKVLGIRGNCVAAIEQYAKALASAHDLDNKDLETCLLIDIADLHRRCGHATDAITCLERAERIQATRGLPLSPRHALVNVRVLLESSAPEDVEQAGRIADNVLAAPILISDEEAVSVHELEIEACALLARALERQGDRDRARQLVARATAVIDGLCRSLDEGVRPTFRAKPQIAAVDAMRARLAVPGSTTDQGT